MAHLDGKASPSKGCSEFGKVIIGVSGALYYNISPRAIFGLSITANSLGGLKGRVFSRFFGKINTAQPINQTRARKPSEPPIVIYQRQPNIDIK